MTCLKKMNLTIPFLGLGLVLIFYSWHVSYPVSIDSPYDFVFNHISPLYWLGFSLFLGSLYIISSMVKSRNLKLIACVSIVAAIFSLRCFYYSLPGSDVHFSRGLMEYYMQTSDLDPSKPFHAYFKWPLFFILNQVTHSITGLKMMHFEFVLFAILGILYITSLFVYTSRFSKDGNFLAIVAYFIVLYRFLDYQFAPFSLALGFLYILFMFETHTFKTREVKVVSMMIFTIMTLVHPFMAVFFILYTFAMYVTGRNKYYLQLLLFTLVVYLAILIYFSSFFSDVLKQLSTVYLHQYRWEAEEMLAGWVASTPPIAAVASNFSRAIVFLTGVIVGLGFLFLLIKRELRHVDAAIFISAVSYIAAGFILPILGMRALFTLFIPVSLGTTYFLERKFGKYLKALLLVFVILFPFTVISESFDDAEIMFQTRESYQCANFMISYYNWTKPSSILSHLRVMHYLQTKSASQHASFGSDLAGLDSNKNVSDYDCIVYTVGVGKTCLFHNRSIMELLGETKHDRVFDNGISHVTIEANSSYNIG